MPEPTEPSPDQPSPSTASFSAKPGWHDDGSGRQRWWDGASWTEIYAPGPPVSAVAGSKRPWFKPTVSTWIVASLVSLLLIVSISTSGFSGFLIMVGTAAFVTALYVVITGRRSWASVPSRKIGAIVLATGFILTFAGGAVAGPVDIEPVVAEAPATSPSPRATPKPSPSPSYEFTDEAPADPVTVEQPLDNAAVAVTDTSVTDTTALALLATIPVKGKAPQTGYDRTGMFGSAWVDVDRNGCDTRNDILARDLTNVVKSGPCKVTSGSLTSPFTSAVIAFVRGNDTSAMVQIDHVVALSNSWQTGAQQLTQAQRVSLANDPINLLAVDGRSNAQKGAGDSATWLPSNKAIRCAYVARQVSVKATYGLWVTQAEHDAMSRVLGDCSSEPALTSSFTPAPAPPPPPPPVEAPAPAPVPAPVAPPPTVSVYYENCDAVRAAGAAPIYAGQPGYALKLDRDKDGIGCDT